MKKEFDREKYLKSDEGKHLIKCVEFMADERIFGLSRLLSEVGYTNIDYVIGLLKESKCKFGNLLDHEVNYDIHDDIDKINDEYDVFLTIDDGENTGVIFSDRKYLDMSDEEYALIQEEIDANRGWFVKAQWKRSDIDEFGAYFILRSCVSKDVDSDSDSYLGSDTDIIEERIEKLRASFKKSLKKMMKKEKKMQNNFIDAFCDLLIKFNNDD